MTTDDVKNDIAELRSIAAEGLAPYRAALVAHMRRLPGLSYPEDSSTSVYFEIEWGGLSEGSGIYVTLDGPAPRDVFNRVQVSFDESGPVLTEKDEARFLKLEEDGETEALKQPVIDGGELERTVVLPFVMECWEEAAVAVPGVQVLAGLHDSADWAVPYNDEVVESRRAAAVAG